MVQTITDNFTEHTSLFKCAPCKTSAPVPTPEKPEYPWRDNTEPWQRVKLPDTPYQLKPLNDSAPPSGGYMGEIDQMVKGEAAQDAAPQERESKVLWAGVILLSTFCIYCKVNEGAIVPKTEQESIADYQQRMRADKAEKPGEELRPAVRIPQLKNRTREGQRP